MKNLKQETYILINLLNVFTYLKQDDLKNDVLKIHHTPSNAYAKLIEDWGLLLNFDVGSRRLSENYLTKMYLDQRTNYSNVINDFEALIDPGNVFWLKWYQPTIWDEYKFVSVTLALKRIKLSNISLP